MTAMTTKSFQDMGVYIMEEDGENPCFVSGLYSLCMEKPRDADGNAVSRNKSKPRAKVDAGYSLFGLTEEFLSWLNGRL